MNVLSRACPSHNVQAQEASPPSQSKLRKPPRVNNEKDFFPQEKEKCQQRGAQADPKAAAGSSLWSTACKKQMLHRNS